MIVCTVLAVGASLALAAAFPAALADGCAPQQYGWAPSTGPAVVCLSGPWVRCVSQRSTGRGLLA